MRSITLLEVKSGYDASTAITLLKSSTAWEFQQIDNLNAILAGMNIIPKTGIVLRCNDDINMFSHTKAMYMSNFSMRSKRFRGLFFVRVSLFDRAEIWTRPKNKELASLTWATGGRSVYLARLVMSSLRLPYLHFLRSAFAPQTQKRFQHHSQRLLHGPLRR